MCGIPQPGWSFEGFQLELQLAEINGPLAEDPSTETLQEGPPRAEALFIFQSHV